MSAMDKSSLTRLFCILCALVSSVCGQQSSALPVVEEDNKSKTSEDTSKFIPITSNSPKFSIGLGVLSPSYVQKFGDDGSLSRGHSLSLYLNFSPNSWNVWFGWPLLRITIRNLSIGSNISSDYLYLWVLTKNLDINDRFSLVYGFKIILKLRILLKIVSRHSSDSVSQIRLIINFRFTMHRRMKAKGKPMKADSEIAFSVKVWAINCCEE